MANDKGVRSPIDVMVTLRGAHVRAFGDVVSRRKKKFAEQ
jgi:hypothetical protein